MLPHLQNNSSSDSKPSESGTRNHTCANALDASATTHEDILAKDDRAKDIFKRTDDNKKCERCLRITKSEDKNPTPATVFSLNDLTNPEK